MLIVMISDTPLPMPRSVICSPSQVKTIVVQVITSTVIGMNTDRLPMKSCSDGAGNPSLLGLTIAIATMVP